jgi:hypothetical protein
MFSRAVMAGLRPGHPRLLFNEENKTWMPGTSPGMTNTCIPFSGKTRRRRAASQLAAMRRLRHDRGNEN